MQAALSNAPKYLFGSMRRPYGKQAEAALGLDPEWPILCLLYTSEEYCNGRWFEPIHAAGR